MSDLHVCVPYSVVKKVSSLSLFRTNQHFITFFMWSWRKIDSKSCNWKNTA